MDASRNNQNATKDMYSTGRRSAISTSELGLYSDYSDHYKTDNYGNAIRKFVIGIMVVVSVILIGIFLYDFTSSASISSKASQETKHIYILQNSLRKGLVTTRKPTVTYPPTIYIVNTSNATLFEDRSDDAPNVEYKEESKIEKPSTKSTEQPSSEQPPEQRMVNDEPELRMQNLQNYKLRNTLLGHRRLQGEIYDNNHIDNHAIKYRARLKVPGNEEIVDDNEGDASSDEENRRAIPFRFELKGPHPASFKQRPRYPQLTQYRYPHASRNIQDIIKYLTSDPETLNRGFKFTGFYVNPKKYDGPHTDIGVVAMNSDPTSEEEEQVGTPYAAVGSDPLYQYKPKHPTDVNLLATSNFRFSPVGMQRYNPYYDAYYQRPSSVSGTKHAQYQENVGAHSANEQQVTSYSPAKKRKPKPFSVMLDIYPITEATDQAKRASRPKSQVVMMMDEPDSRRPPPPPPSYGSRRPKVYGQLPHATQTQAIYSQPPHQTSHEDEEDKHQMILHLNLYPKKKSKHPRNELIDRSQSVSEDVREELINQMMVPFDMIAKHLADHAAVEEAKSQHHGESEESNVRYEETILAKDGFANDVYQADEFVNATENSKGGDADFVTKTMESTMATVEAAPTINTTSMETIIVTESAASKQKYSANYTDIDTVEGFQQFADSLIATD